ncbi:MAG: HAMP domain-containing protein, partial [Spirochaetota bacterium]
ERTAARFGIVLVKLFRPSGKAAKAARGFTILTAMEFLLSILVVLSAVMHTVPEFTLNIILNAGFMIIYFWYIIIYINRSPYAFSFIYKIIGVTLITVLLAVSSAGYVLIMNRNASYDALKQSQSLLIPGAEGSESMKDLPPDLVFIARTAADGHTEIQYNTNAQIEMDKIRQSLSQNGDAQRIYLRMQMTNYYCFAHSHGSSRYLFGYDYISYRKDMHDAILSLIIIIISSALFVIILFPVITYLSFISPIRDLLCGVERVNRNDLDTQVPVHFEDEIGSVARAFNKMVFSLRASKQALQNHTDHLEEIVSERTSELQNTLATLKDAQDQLIRTETMASLGNLVAGIAHEINTPIGISLTASTHMKQAVSAYNKIYKEGNLRKSDFENLLTICTESSDIIQSNIDRASGLIQSFKKVAVDRSAGQVREFFPGEYFNDIILSLHPHLKKTKISVSINGNPDISIFSDPGVFAQILTNLILNAVTHAFAENESGTIRI